MGEREGYHRGTGPWQPSEAQRSVLDALAKGLTNAEIAASLGLSLNTVKWHISQLLDETGARDRDGLALWWRDEEDEGADTRPAPSLIWAIIFSRAAVGVSLVVLVAVGIAVTFDARSVATGDPPEPTADADLAARAERLKAFVASLPTPTPDPRRRAWVFDIADARATPIEFFPGGAFNVFGSAKWLEDGRSIFGSWAGGYGVVRPDGQLEASFPASQGGFLPGVVALPVRGTRSLLIWRASSGNLTIMDIDGKTERTIAALPDAQDLKLSPDGSTLAFTRKQPEAVEVVLLSLADASQRILTTFSGEDAAASIESWSPDGRALLLLGGKGTYVRLGSPSAQVETRYGYDWSRYVVVDMAGNELWEHPTCEQLCAIMRVEWAGAGRLFVGSGGDYNLTSGARRTEGYFQTLSPPSTSAAVAFDGYVRCFSPSGRYVYWQDSDSTEVVWDLWVNKQMLRVKTGSYTGSCGWTEDERKLVVSSGGV